MKGMKNNREDGNRTRDIPDNEKEEGGPEDQVIE
jgi:hypothetical protein